jgi:glucosylglycerate phosphorylase
MNENRKRITKLVKQLYDQSIADEAISRIEERLQKYEARFKIKAQIPQADPDLTERDAILITYGDQFTEERISPLQALTHFLKQNLSDVISGVHILPFFPYSSDDGFSVIDYSQVDPQKGSWQDISDLEEHFKLMFDLVANHISSQSDWFQAFLRNETPYNAYFIVQEPDINLSNVVRPRATPILTPFETAAGLKYVWTTFSVDQIDLNYQTPDVLLDMIDILLFYVEKGANLIRLDAIAYLWKIPGTSCIHLDQTHAVVKLFRAILDEVAPYVYLITETNVPHEENISYFGAFNKDSQRTDEAQLVYQFPLAPLILHTFLTGDASILAKWVADLPPLAPGTCFFNFTASHDGIGIRPAENLLEPEQVEALIGQTTRHGGKVSYKANPDGTQSAYELNITWYDALNNPAQSDEDLDIARFLASQAIMLSMAGVPGIYVHSLFGSRNCLDCVKESNRFRSINREKFGLSSLNEDIADTGSLKSAVFVGYRKLLAVRKEQAAFHPLASQEILQGNGNVFSIIRKAKDGEMILCLINVTGDKQVLDMISGEVGLPSNGVWKDLLSGDEVQGGERLVFDLKPYQSCWYKFEL